MKEINKTSLLLSFSSHGCTPHCMKEISVGNGGIRAPQTQRAAVSFRPAPSSLPSTHRHVVRVLGPAHPASSLSIAGSQLLLNRSTVSVAIVPRHCCSLAPTRPLEEAPALVLDMDGKKIPGPVKLACGWVLLSACAMALVHHRLSCSQATSVLHCRCAALTDTKAAYFSALWIGTLCCAGSQATAAALALLLPRRPVWIGRELAHLAAAVAWAGHFMYHVAICILRPGGYFPLASLVFVVGDIICSLAFYLGGEE